MDFNMPKKIKWKHHNVSLKTKHICTTETDIIRF